MSPTQEQKYLSGAAHHNAYNSVMYNAQVHSYCEHLAVVCNIYTHIAERYRLSSRHVYIIETITACIVRKEGVTYLFTLILHGITCIIKVKCGKEVFVSRGEVFASHHKVLKMCQY